MLIKQKAAWLKDRCVHIGIEGTFMETNLALVNSWGQNVSRQKK